jgi:nucleotide-binding universal stress UspA family protein
MYRSNNILALIPPDDEGKKILNHALFFRESLGMRIFIFNIIEKPSFFRKLFQPEKISLEKKEELSILHNFVEKNAGADACKDIALRVQTGKLLKILISQSKIGGYEFMIIDKSKDRGSLTRDEIDKIISRSYCPVMTVNKNYPVKEIKKIIIPVDISQATKKKLLWATYFAKKFNAKIRIVSALNINLSPGRSLAWRNAEELKYMLHQRNVDCDVEILKTKSKEKHKVIHEYIAKEDPGLVIIRTHQESNMSGTQIGKFVSEIIHECNIPVFTVNRFLYPMPVDFEY